MSAFSRLYRGETDINFPKLWKPVLAFSVALLIASIVSLIVQGLVLSIDFRGGAVWEVPSKSLTTQQATDILTDFNREEGAKVQIVKDADNNRIVRIQAEKSKNIAESESIATALADKAGLTLDDVTTNTVGPSWGASITKDAVKALVVFLVMIALYISWQLEWRMALSALVAVVHDVIITVGVYSFTRFAVTPATVISFLTILGFSLYDTIVVYDRVQDNTKRYDRTGQFTYLGIMRRSLNQVLMRSLNTTFVAILPVLSILIIGGVVYGQTVMFDFALALLVGLIVGAYSSLAVAAPVVVFLKEREEKYRKIRQRAKDRGTEAAADWIPPSSNLLVGAAVAGRPSAPAKRAGATTGAGGAQGSSAAASSATASNTAAKAAQYQRPTPPRPRKQGKKR